MKIRMLVSLLALPLLVSVFAVQSYSQDKGKWVVPEKYKTMKNPLAGDASSVDLGKDLYARYCKACHGKTGLGDGPKAASLGTSCGDFTTKEFKSQPDGVIFYMISFGKDKMPGFSKPLPQDNDRWALVNYMKTLK